MFSMGGWMDTYFVLEECWQTKDDLHFFLKYIQCMEDIQYTGRDIWKSQTKILIPNT